MGKVEKEKPKNKDPVTKAAVAKKILKKGIKANQVLKFDEEGDAIENVNTQKISQEGKDYDENKELNESTNGGINIAEAARILKAEDLYDKQIEREKMRIRKKEEKRKAKEARKKKEQIEEESMQHSESESDSEDDGPELDWLPDPDKVYGSKDGNNDNSSISGDESIQEDESKSTKRKWKPPKKNKGKDSKNKH